MPDGVINTGIGAEVKRVEDFRFLTGNGNYTDDINRPNQTYAYMLRSPHAHATINSIDTAAAETAPGVVAIFTGDDMQVGGLPCGWQIHSEDGSPMHEPPHPSLAQGKVRHVGDQVAVVIADTLEQAKKRSRANKRRLRYSASGNGYESGRSRRSSSTRRDRNK
jgi:carbon-monoxide dehydrogenase large subunit